MALEMLLKHDMEAADFYYSLHPSIRRVVDEHSDEIVIDEDLIAVANNAMTEELIDIDDIFDDSDSSWYER